MSGLLALTCIGVGCQSVTADGATNASGVRRVWMTATGGDPTRGWIGLPALAGDTVIVGLEGPVALAALDMRSGALLWKSAPWAQTHVPGQNVVSRGGRACVSAWGGIACVLVANGQALWSRESDTFTGVTETAVDDDAWYVGTTDHHVTAYDPASGAVRWTTDVTPDAQFRIATVFGVGVAGDTLYAATVRWVTEQGGSVAGDLVALDRRTGRVLLRYTSSPKYDAVNTRGGFQGAPLVHGRLVIVNDVYWHALIAIDRFTGQEVWRSAQDPGGYLTSETQPTIVGDTIFAASTDTQLYALDVTTGRRIWRAVVRPGSLGNLAVCNSALLTREFAGGPLFVTSRSSHESYVASGLVEGDRVFSRIAVSGDLAVFGTGRGVYAYRCS